MNHVLPTPLVFERASQLQTVSSEEHPESNSAIPSNSDLREPSDKEPSENSNKKALDHKKQNGVFYTPDAATRLLAGWAIRQADDLVLEPSFGGCGFLDAALDRLKQLNAVAPTEQLYGCDVDPQAFEHLNELLPSAPDANRFKKCDFLSTNLSDFAIPGVDALIGNPPYVSWHTMFAVQREAASKITSPSGRTLKKKGSLWAFFVVHSLNFMKRGGRMAWILPSGFLHSDYAAPLRAIVASYFTKTLAVALEERLFLEEGTEESSVILLCEGYRMGQSEPMRLTSAKNLAQLAETIDHWTLGKELGTAWNQRATLLLAPPHITKSYSTLQSSQGYHTLSQLIRIRIGLVTGDNKFFVLSRAQAESHQLPDSVLRPIVARLAHFKGLEVCPQDLEALAEAGARCFLVDTAAPAVPALATYLSNYPAQQRLANYTFGKRPVWHQVDDGLNPEAFFSCMSSQGPALTLNEANTTCTNTIYKVWFSSKATTTIKRQIALSLQSTFSQFSAEVVGRSHGSSALKLEPSEVLRLGLLLPSPSVDPVAAYQKVDAELRLGNLNAARRAADEFLISQGLITKNDIETLEAGLVTLRAIRQRKR